MYQPPLKFVAHLRMMDSLVNEITGVGLDFQRAFNRDASPEKRRAVEDECFHGIYPLLEGA